MGMPPSAVKMIFARCRSGCVRVKLKRGKTYPSAMAASSHAMGSPRHARGPPWNGKYVYGLGRNPAHRSGRKSSASAPQMSFRRCNTTPEYRHTSPLRMVYPSTLWVLLQ